MTRHNQGAEIGKQMTRKGISKKIERTPEELARLRKVREEFQNTRPSLDAIAQSGNYEIVSHGDYLELSEALSELKKARQAQNLSLSDVSERCGVDKAAISRLENGLNLNPTFKTLESVAHVVGLKLKIVFEREAA
jgi:DNA-binding XRE family transcriptional regulator